MFVVIPIKPFDQAKTRLAPALAPEQRRQLSRYLLMRTLSLALPVGQVVVVSRDAAVRRLAKQAGAWALVEAEPDLNLALRQAAGWVLARGGQDMLILPGDLPRLEPADLAGLVSAARPGPAVVIAPSRRFDGTNALLLRPPTIIPLSFGPDSFTRHVQAARQAGLEPAVYLSDTLAFDLDLPQDWREWQVLTAFVQSGRAG